MTTYNPIGPVHTITPFPYNPPQQIDLTKFSICNDCACLVPNDSMWSHNDYHQDLACFSDTFINLSKKLMHLNGLVNDLSLLINKTYPQGVTVGV